MKQAQSKKLQSDATATGNGNVFNVAGFSLLCVQVLGITTATVTFEGSNDGATFAAVPFYNSAGSAVSTATANGVFVTNLCGYSLFRARISAYTSGTINVYASGNG